MSMHRSLRTSGRLRRARNVLTRDERLAQLESEGRWEQGQPVRHLPKTRNPDRVKKGKR